jgi:phosphate-transporting ATPase
LLRAVADLDPNEGEVSLDGRDRASIPAPEWRGQAVYLPADAGWWADRVGEHFPDHGPADAIITRLGLPEESLGWEIARLSTGERQRLALARALLLSPKALLLDEPTSGLDEDSTRLAEEELKSRLGEGCTILMVTHSREQARRMAARLLIIENGVVREEAL